MPELDKRKKILHVVSVSFSLSYFIGNQFTYFKDRNCEIHVACTGSEDLHDLAQRYGFIPFSIPILRNISPFEDIKSILRLRKYINKQKFDIVIAHSPKGGLIGMLASFLARTNKRVFFRHGLVFETSKGLKRKILVNIEKLTSYCAHKVINVSPSVQAQAAHLKLNSLDKNVILGKGTCNGVDIRRFVPKQKILGLHHRSVIGFVGRLCRDKGIVELIEAWKLLERKLDNIELLLVGPYDERDQLPTETRAYIERAKSIRHVGGVDDASSYYQEMDVFILPSYREGFPTVILEASASGLPVITTKNTGCIDAIIENSTGKFTNLSSLKIAESIEFYIRNSDIAAKHGANGRNFVVENFSEEFVYSEIETKILN